MGVCESPRHDAHECVDALTAPTQERRLVNPPLQPPFQTAEVSLQRRCLHRRKRRWGHRRYSRGRHCILRVSLIKAGFGTTRRRTWNARSGKLLKNLTSGPFSRGMLRDAGMPGGVKCEALTGRAVECAPFIPAVYAEVAFIDSDDHVARVKLTHSNNAQIGQVWLPILISCCKFHQLLQVSRTIESQAKHIIVRERKHIRARCQVKCRFSKHRFARQQRFRYPFCNLQRPRVVPVVAVSKGDDETCVRDSLHRWEKALRIDRSTGPLILPACPRKRWPPPSFFAFSNCWRIIRPAGKPVLRAVSASHAASSSVRRTRTVIV